MCNSNLCIIVIVYQLVRDKIAATKNVEQINNCLFLIEEDLTTSANIHTFWENRKAFW